MKKLLVKEMKLSANPLSCWFISFAAMTLIPRYPILIGSFFVCLGIFYTYQQIREYDDITYTVMLPIRRKDVVTSKYLFVLLIQLVAFTLCALFTLIRMKFLVNVEPYLSNPLMNANATYLGFVLMIFAAFNSIFLKNFFKTTYKIGKPFIIFCVLSFMIVLIAEALHHIPGVESLNSPSDISTLQLLVLTLGMVLFIVCTWVSHNKAIHYFEKIDL